MQVIKNPKIRKAIYAANLLAVPLVVYARAMNWIGDLEVTLFLAESAAVFGLAGLNTDTKN